MSSAAAVAWQFAAKDPETRERKAFRFIAWSFFALAAYVSFDAATSLIGGSEAQHSAVGLVLAAVSLVLMPWLSYGQRRTGRELTSRTAVADSKQNAAVHLPVRGAARRACSELAVRIVMSRPDRCAGDRCCRG